MSFQLNRNLEGLHMQKSYIQRRSADIIGSNDDLLQEIMLFLHAKSLLRFRSVCKRWRSLISAPSFSPLHTLHHNRRSLPQQSFLFCSTSHIRPPKYFIYHSKLKNAAPFRFISFPRFSFQKVEQSCNGLLLVKCWNTCTHCYYFIYNPTTMQSRKLSSRIKSEGRNAYGFHLVFDPSKSPYYKVFCFKTESKDLWFEVYDSQTHTWAKGSKICHRPPGEFLRTKGVYWEGALYFLCKNSGTLYCFDLTEFEFYQIDVPESENPIGRHSYNLLESNGHLHYVVQDMLLKVTFCVYERKKDESCWFTYRDNVNLSLYVSFSELPFLGLIRGEREEDTAMLFLTRPKKIGVYRFSEQIFNELDIEYCFNYQLSGEHFIDSLTSV